MKRFSDKNCVKTKTALGVGMSGTDYDKRIIPHIRQCLAMLEIGCLDAIATIEKKQHHPVVVALAFIFKAPIVSFSCSKLEAQTPYLANPSDELYARLGCHGVAEAAALAAAGAGGRLVIPKTICHKVTFAVASKCKGEE